MEQIEIRSEKIRNLIGIIPPNLIRIGNLLIFILLVVMIIIGSFIKVPNILACNVQAYKKDDGTVALAVVSISKAISQPIEEGKSLKIYMDGVLLYTGKLNEKIDKIIVSLDTLKIFIPVTLDETITTKEQMTFILENSACFICNIEIDNQPIINNIFRNILQ